MMGAVLDKERFPDVLGVPWLPVPLVASRKGLTLTVRKQTQTRPS